MLLFSSIKGVFFYILEQIKSVAGAQQGLRAACADRVGLHWGGVGFTGTYWDHQQGSWQRGHGCSFKAGDDQI